MILYIDAGIELLGGFLLPDWEQASRPNCGGSCVASVTVWGVTATGLGSSQPFSSINWTLAFLIPSIHVRCCALLPGVFDNCSLE